MLWESIDYIILQVANIPNDMMKPHERQEQMHYNLKILGTDYKLMDVL